MTTITATAAVGSGVRALSEATLNGTLDTFVYDSTAKSVLILRNPTAGALSPVIDGDGATNINVPGAGSFDISGGYAVGSIAVGDAVAIPLDSISAYLAGTIAITGGTGLVGALLEY